MSVFAENMRPFKLILKLYCSKMSVTNGTGYDEGCVCFRLNVQLIRRKKGRCPNLQFAPGVKHNSQKQVFLVDQGLEGLAEACAQGLAEVAIVGGTCLQSLIEANYRGDDG